jgi:hypothetical protein
MIASFVGHRRSVMKPVIALKLGSIAFAVLWTGGMLWSSGTIDRANFIILSVCGALAGSAWHYAMRWMFQLMRLSPSSDQSAHPGSGQ